MKTTSRRRFAAGEKKCDVTTGTRAEKLNARPSLYGWLGGGSSMPTDCVNVCAKSAGSVVGMRSGSVRSVSDAMPTGTSPRTPRSFRAIRFARTSREGCPGPADASIDRDVSITKNACALPRSFTSCRRTTTGCAAATPTRTGRSASATIAGTSARRPGTDDAEHGANVAAPPLGDEQRRERQRGREREERAERREERDAEERDEHQYPLPSFADPCPRPKPKPACASLPIGPLPGRVTRRTSSRFCFACAFVGSRAIACWK